MATTVAITEPVPGILVYSYTALAAGDSVTIDCTGADKILFQASAGTFGDSTLSLSGSILGGTFTGVYAENDLATGVAANSGQITATTPTGVIRVQPTGFLRIALSGTTGTGIACQVMVNRKVRH